MNARLPLLMIAILFGTCTASAQDALKVHIKDKDFPVTWVNTYKGGRYFYTSLGAPEDFQQDGMNRLLSNAVFWTSQRDPEKLRKQR